MVYIEWDTIVHLSIYLYYPKRLLIGVLKCISK